MRRMGRLKRRKGPVLVPRISRTDLKKQRLEQGHTAYVAEAGKEEGGHLVLHFFDKFFCDQVFMSGHAALIIPRIVSSAMFWKAAARGGGGKFVKHDVS